VAEAHFPGVMTLQILVVENHGDTRRVLTGLLGHFGHSISAADNVESALAFVRAKHFDAIVSDLALPDGSGYDVIREAKRCQQLTGVALTANGEEDEIAWGRDAGFDYHLTKPVDFAQLREVLAQIAPASNGEIRSSDLRADRAIAADAERNSVSRSGRGGAPAPISLLP
jgi:CheY-like chemotaxis protein